MISFFSSCFTDSASNTSRNRPEPDFKVFPGKKPVILELFTAAHEAFPVPSCNPDKRDKYHGGLFNHTISNDIPQFLVFYDRFSGVRH